jgi:hypothetical protein
MDSSLWLTPEALTLVEIKNREGKGEVYFSKLKELFSGEYSPATINKCVKKLEEGGVIICTWKLSNPEDSGRNRWIRDIHISKGFSDLAGALEDVTNICLGRRE